MDIFKFGTENNGFQTFFKIPAVIIMVFGQVGDIEMPTRTDKGGLLFLDNKTMDRMKTRICTLILVYLLLCACSTAQQSTWEERVIYALKSFYTEYITAMDIPFSTFPDGSIGWTQNLKSIQQKYSTQRLLNHIDSLTIYSYLDFDPYIQAQDSWIGWLETMRVRRDLEGENNYSVFFWRGYEYGYIRIRMTVVEKDGQIKIDELLNIFDSEYVDACYFEKND